MTVKRRWAGQLARVAGVVLTAGVLTGCLELDMKETVEVDGSIVSGEFSYTLVIPEDLEEIDPEGATGLSACLLSSAGDPLPPAADRERRELGEVGDLLGLEKTHESKVGQIVRCAWVFRVDLAEWVPDPQSPLFAHVEYFEQPRRGWWVHQVPPGELLEYEMLDELPEGTLEALLGSVTMTSRVSGEGVIAEGYARQDDGSWHWSGTLPEILQTRPRYWIPG